MAVEDKYVSAALSAGKLENAALCNGARMIQMVATEEIAAADTTLSVYRFFKGVSGNLIVTKIEVYGDAAIVGPDDLDLGLYEQAEVDADGDANGGTVIDADIFGTAIDVDGITAPATPVDGMDAVTDPADRVKKIYELAGHTAANAKDGYDIGLLLNTVASTGGTVTIVLTGVEG